MYDIVVVMDAADARLILKVSLDVEEERHCCDGDCGRDQTRRCCATRQGVRSSFQKGKFIPKLEILNATNFRTRSTKLLR